MIFAQELLKEVLWTLLHVCGPLLISLLVIGIVISLIQTLTQIQEPGLLFISKFLVVVIFIFAFSEKSSRYLIELGRFVFEKIVYHYN